MTVITEENTTSASDVSEAIKEAARNGLLKDIVELSTKLSNEVKLMSEALILSCVEGHLSVVK